MGRRPMAKLAALLCVVPLLLMDPAARPDAQEVVGGGPLLAAPIWVYNNWSAYDELSDNVPPKSWRCGNSTRFCACASSGSTSTIT
jgi:hypothetical protein